MSVVNLDAIFKPKSVAIIGASDRAGSLGEILYQNTKRHFAGAVYAINPGYRWISGSKAYANATSLPEVPDLALVATPPHSIPALLRELAGLGVPGVCVLTAGFGEGTDPQGRQLREDLIQICEGSGLRIIGPNCVGLQVPGVGLNASFLGSFPPPGDIALVAQSGAMITALLDWAQPQNIGFSHTVSLGDMIDVDFGDMFEYLAADTATRSVLLYIESVTNVRKFMRAARLLSKNKPVVVVKAGRFAAGARAAASHTGALAGVDEVYEAAFRRAGLVRVTSLEDLFDCAETLATHAIPAGETLTVVTNGGGIGVLAADAAAEVGVTLAQLSKSTSAQLDEVLPPTWSHANPIDLIGDATDARYTETLQILLADDAVDGILVMNCPTALISSDRVAQAVVDLLSSDSTIERVKPVLTCWVGAASAEQPRKRFNTAGIATFESPEDAVRAWRLLLHRRDLQQLMHELATCDNKQLDLVLAEKLISKVLADNREWLDEIEAMALLRSAGIPVVATEQANTPEAVAEIATRLDCQVVIKILSPDILHKSDVGGVALRVAPGEALGVANALQAEVARQAPAARLNGFLVQEMVKRHQGRELIVGMIDDVQFGPVMLVGHGGTAVEVINDKALDLPPLNRTLARNMLTRTRVHALLEGYRDVAAADLDAVDSALICLSDLVCQFPQIVELDINPLIVDADGAIALDARVRVSANANVNRLAIPQGNTS